MALSSSIKLVQTMAWARRFVFQRRLNFGNFNEPAISSANTILQTILGPPFSWPWNRAVTGFICTPGVQDYTIFNWQATTAITKGYVLVDSNGNSQSVTTGGTTGSSAPTWNVTTGGTTTDGSVTWTNLGHIGLSQGSQTYSFGWIETASVNVPLVNSNGTIWKEIETKNCLGVDSVAARPHDIAPQFIDANGNITFRLMPSPDQAYQVSIAVQQRPALFTGVNQTWGNIPDSYSHLYNWGFLSLMFMFADDQRFQFANQKFIAHILSTNQGLSETERNIWLNNWQAVTGQQVMLPTTIQQGYAGRQAL
jgi:hypothetical protein